MLWIRIRIDLTVLDPDSDPYSDPYWPKLTTKPDLLPFKKVFEPSWVCFFVPFAFTDVFSTVNIFFM